MRKKKRNEAAEIWAIFFFMAVIVLIFMGAISNSRGNRLEQLGKSICEKEFHMDYVEFTGGQLHCAPRDTTIKYDGITVVIDKVNINKIE